MAENNVIVVVPCSRDEADLLVEQLYRGGHVAQQYDSINDMMLGAGFETYQVGEVDVERYTEWIQNFERIANPRPGRKYDDTDIVKTLGLIGMVLSDIALTHKKAMPPLG